MRIIHSIRGPILAGLLFLAAPMSFGQAVYGSIFGTVVDSTGAAIPGATVVVTDVAKGTSSTLTSNGSGEFTADHLIPDHYDVKVSFTGFKTFEAANLPVFADTSQMVQAVLPLDGTEQTFEVTA